MSVAVIRGTDPSGSLKTIAVTEEGRLIVSGSGTGDGGTTDPATGTNQSTLNQNFGDRVDAAATTDTGSFSLIALVKRLISIKLPSALSGDRFKVESQLIATARTTSFINTTGSGTIAAGANSIAIANIGAAAGTVKSVSLPAGCAISFAANGNDTLDLIDYSATNTNFLITTVV